MMVWQDITENEGLLRTSLPVCAWVLQKRALKKPFQSRDENLVAFDKKPERSNRTIFSLVYCPEKGCSESFESAAILENMYLQAVIEGTLKYLQWAESKKIFINKMICSAQFHHPYVSRFVEKDNVSFPEVIQNILLVETFANGRWVLPVQKRFKYSYKQLFPIRQDFLNYQFER